MVLKQTVERFLKAHVACDKPLLLAFSGGPDSTALYHVLMELNVEFAVAHVDHGWRKESAEQAEQLRRQVSVPFHLMTLDPSSIKGNLEEQCREQRLHFFETLVKNNGYHAVLMGHHADDLAETVLKRLFEGATFTQLGGMQEASLFHGMLIWRPLLSVPKRAILAYCEKNGLRCIDDGTNRDPKYLRARMRESILPFLTESFGKEIAKPLARLQSQAFELKDYLDARVEGLLQKRKKTEDGWELNLNDLTHPVEIKHLLKQFLISHEQIETAASFILQKQTDRRVGPFYIHQGYLFHKATGACDDIPDLLSEEYKLTVDDE